MADQEQIVTAQALSQANGQAADLPWQHQNGRSVPVDGVCSPTAPLSALLADGNPLSADQGRSCHILLVEDDADSRACMASLLELEGYAVETAADGEEALRRLRNGLAPGLIVLDLMMPGMDGFQFRKEQLQDPKLSAIPVVIYSGHHDAKDNTALLTPNAYIQKPIDFDTFLDLVGAHCVRQQAAAA